MTTKYAIIIPDGAADEPLEQFDDKTPLEAAQTPNIDSISKLGRQGLIQTVPEKMEPGSDVAQMSLLGYDPRRYYTGRAPIEAVEPRDEAEPSDPDSSAEPTMETTPSPSPTVDVGADGSGVFATVGGVF